MNQQGFRSIVSSSCQYHTSLIFMDLFYKNCCLPVLLNIVTCARLWIITYERKKDRLIWSQRKASPLPAYFRTAESKLWAEGCLSESMSSSQQGSWCTSVLHFCYSSVPIMLTFTLPIEKEPTVIQLGDLYYPVPSSVFLSSGNKQYIMQCYSQQACQSLCLLKHTIPKNCLFQLWIVFSVVCFWTGTNSKVIQHCYRICACFSIIYLC